MDGGGPCGFVQPPGQEERQLRVRNGHACPLSQGAGRRFELSSIQRPSSVSIQHSPNTVVC